MDLDNSNALDNLFWNLIEEEFMDNTNEELLMSMLEKECLSGSSSRRKKRTMIDQSREEGHHRLFSDYFSENPVYTDVQFRRRFRMNRHVFLRIVDALGNPDAYFQMRADATSKMGLSPLQKCTFAIFECLARFVRGVNDVFGAEYLRKPNNVDVEHLLQMGESRGFPDSNNDINVLNQSNVFNEVLEGHAPTVQYTINGTPCNMGYYLADGIYPEWAIFVKTISMPQGEKRKLFAQHQESAIKDVEQAFGVLQSQFVIIRGPHTIYACIILHNMIVEDERHTYGGDFDYSYDNVNTNNSTAKTFNGPHPNLATRLQRRASLHEKQVHRQFQGDLVEHIWEYFGHEADEI